VFVRTSVCDSRCKWCRHAARLQPGRADAPRRGARNGAGFDCPLVEITGGEPLLQADVFPLMTELCDAGQTVLLETSGAHDVSEVDRRVHISWT